MPKRKALIALFVLFGVFLAFSVNFIRGKYVAPILMYHYVNNFSSPKDPLAVSPEIFERQMRFLKMHHYNVVPLESLAGLTRERKVPPGTVAITLDDGYKDNYIYVFPVLKKYNFPASIFLIVNEVDRPQNDRLSWKEIKEMRESGLVSFGSHTFGPEPLTNLKSKEEIKRQIFDSKKALEEKLGCKVSAFSYPEGKFNDTIRQLVIEAGYKFAVATNPGKEFPSDDIFALKRLRISSNCRNLFIFWAETSGYYNFMREHRHKK